MQNSQNGKIYFNTGIRLDTDDELRFGHQVV